MTLRIYTGTANVGKTGVLYARLRERVRDGEPGLLLLPSAPDVTRDLIELSHDIPVGLSVVTFDAYLDHQWTGMHPEQEIVGPSRRLQILEDIVSHASLGHLAPSATAPGFLGALARFAERTAGVVTATRSRVRPGDAGSEIASLLRAYESRLEAEGLIERTVAHRLVAQAADACSVPGLVAVNRFTGFTAAQEAFLTAIARRTEVLVTLTYHEQVPATHAARLQVDRLSNVGEVIAMPDGCDHTTAPELLRIERALGVPPRQEDDGVAAGQAVILSEAWGEAAEAARVVREVQDAVESGIPAGRVAIAFREPERHAAALRRALDEAGIDADWDLRVRFPSTRLGRFSLLLLDYLSGSVGPAAVLDALRAPYSPASQDALDEIDVRLRSSRVGEVRTFERSLKSADPAAAAFLGEARAAVRSIGAADAEGRWWRMLGGMMRRSRPAGAVLDVEGLLDAAAARRLLEAVAEVRETAAPALAAGVLAAALRASTVTVGPASRPDAVQIMSVERLRGRRYRCVILGGLVAGEFPRQIRDDAFGSPAVRADLARAGIEVPPPGSLDDERLMFYQAVTRASERLVLSWQSHDADGRPLRPSLFVDELLDLYRRQDDLSWRRGAPPHHTLGLDEAETDDWAPRTERRALRRVARTEDEPPASGVADAGQARLAHARYRARTHADGLGRAGRAALAARDTFSVTDIETYLACPYRWYAQRVLRPTEIDVELDAAAAGGLAHEILKVTYDRFIADTGHERIDESTVEQALATHSTVAAEAAERARPASAAERAAVRAVVRHTAGVVAADAHLTPGFVPRYREWSFGLEPGDPPESFGTFALVGRIDRIDVDARRLIVTDYKSGRVSSERGRRAFVTGGLVQAPLYAEVASRRLGLQPVAGVYRSIKGDKPRGFVREDLFECAPSFVSTDRVTAEEVRALIDDAIERAESAVAGMRAGEIPARPRDNACPDYCPARTFCPGGAHAHARAR